MTDFILLMQPQSGAAGQGNPYSSLIFMLLIIAVFYFFMIRPQIKKSKEQRKFIAELQKGDKVLTMGGIHGKIVEVQETTFTIEVESGARMRVEKSAVVKDASSITQTK